MVAAMLGALAGLAFSTMGLVDTMNGFTINTFGGNEATPVVIAAGVAIGAVLGGTVLWCFPLAILGAIVGLAAGIWMRDNMGFPTVQAPWVFFLLFGLPAVGIAVGYSLHLPRTTWSRHSALGGALAGLGAAVASYAVGATLWASATHDPSCDPVPLPDGGLRYPLCAETGMPLWICLVAALLGVAVGLFTRAKLEPSGASGSQPPTTT